MSRLPHENRNVVDRPDLPEYELNKACPVTGEVSGLENHHLWPKSFQTKSWWVELWDGTVVGNRINLSQSAHYRVTVNEARIVYGPDGKFYWEEDGLLNSSPLRWQPPIHMESIEKDYEFLDPVIAEPQEGEECPACKRRVPHKKKASSPLLTKPLTFGRAPSELADELRERAEALGKDAGWDSRPYPQARSINLALLLAESVSKETLKAMAEEMPWGANG